MCRRWWAFAGVAAVVSAGVGAGLLGDAMSDAFRERQKGAGRTALVLGATGATGRKVLAELVAREQWTRVVAIGRRPVDVESDKVENYVVDLSGGEAIDEDRLKGIDHFFNCVGTTRKIAGGADGFHAIEVGISDKVAEAAKQAGIERASVVSAMGANADSWCAPKWFHPLFYGKTMGLKERTLLSRFSRSTVFRPGMLHRGQTDRPMERIFGGILPSLDVALLAKAMVNDAEAPPLAAGKGEPPKVFAGNGVITKLANQEEGPAP